MATRTASRTSTQPVRPASRVMSRGSWAPPKPSAPHAVSWASVTASGALTAACALTERTAYRSARHGAIRTHDPSAGRGGPRHERRITSRAVVTETPRHHEGESLPATPGRARLHRSSGSAPRPSPPGQGIQRPPSADPKERGNREHQQGSCRDIPPCSGRGLPSACAAGDDKRRPEADGVEEATETHVERCTRARLPFPEARASHDLASTLNRPSGTAADTALPGRRRYVWPATITRTGRAAPFHCEDRRISTSAIK